MSADLLHQSVSALRARMIEDMSVRGFTEDTRRDYIRCVKAFAAFIGRSPDLATAEDIRRFQLHQMQAGVQPPSINSAVSALRFFFTVTLDRADLARRLTVVRQPRKLPLVLSVEEVARLLDAAPGPKYKAALGTAYGAGLRVSEVVALKVSDIDSTRMLIRVEQGPFDRLRRPQGSPCDAVAAAAGAPAHLVAGGQAPRRDAVAGLAVPRPQPGHAALHAPAEPRCPCCRGGRRDQEAGDAAHAAPQLRHPSPGAGHRHPRDPGAARACQAGNDGALYSRRHQHDPHRHEPARPDQAAGRGEDETEDLTRRR